MNGVCRFCSNESEGQPFSKWVKPTFTDHDKLQPGDIACADCLFWFEEQSQELAERTGKDKPQRMRNYSHFIVGGEWIPLSKGDKARMVELLLNGPFPELAAVAESGQKHIVFRATRNPVGGKAGWVQFEEQPLFLERDEFRRLLKAVESLYATFSKSEIETGSYRPYFIMQFGIEQWQALENKIKHRRGSLLFKLAMFLAQRKETEANDAGPRNGGKPARHSLAGDRQRLQEPVQADDLGAIREPGEGQQLYQQSRQVRQLGLFEIGGDDTGKIHE